MEGDEASDRDEYEVDQLQAADTLIDRGVDDVLDEGYVAPDGWSPAQGFGNTLAEMRQGESLDMRVKQEEPEHDPQRLEGHWNPLYEDREVGVQRAGRLVVGDDGTVGHDMGFSGGAASAEEAAMHVIDQEAQLEDD
ncbi:DUF5709 domain-containing protein [Tessaracoccus sp. OH4464_COT-324]|uniref:DUF5709 domain-containing protein n=1 Tax=Tessaracoccus sp. OH4464_COT-324 TaxID=2491059 RepID=UPI000F62D401|nr:DUF5709 domain-containing protein [Tessaracoccus sp. OH4464_COT-324]RRD47826.1 hypothetical protein EII42_00800 [Tessaracoccus sp. OH4464_COT-324]